MTKILTVDDDRDILKVIKANIELHGFEVFTAPDCARAATIIAQTAPDLIVLDLMLPDCDGVGFCRELKEARPDLPIIILTARDRLSDKIVGLESGADDYMIKPFESLELLARIRACLRRYQPQREQVLACGELKVEMETRRATLAGTLLNLTPKEFDLLCIMLEAKGKVLSRETMRRRLWKDSRLYSWSRVIDVHIRNLRAKLEDDPTAPRYIQTVPGVGYRCCLKKQAPCLSSKLTES